MVSKTAAVRRAVRSALEAPEARLQHGSKDAWIKLGRAPNADMGQFGIHAGTKAQAKDILRVPKVRVGGLQVRAPTLGHGHVDTVRFKRGREIETPDLEGWYPYAWRKAADAGEIGGMEPDELQHFRRLLDGAKDPDDVRAILQDMGIKRIRYRNAYEGGDPGAYSYVALSADGVVPESIGYNARRVATGAAAGAVVAPQDAGERTNNAQPISAVRR